MGNKRHTTNAMHIAKALGRKGYATEGYVEDENAYLRELQERATQMNQPAQPQQPQPTQPSTVTDYLRQAREKMEGFSPFRIGEAVGRGASEGVQKYFDRPYGYTEQERQNYPNFTAATEQYVPYVQRAARQVMYPFHAIVPGVQAGVTQAAGQFGADPDLARQIGREAAGMTEWGMTRGDIVSPQAPKNTDAIPRGGEVLPPARLTAEQAPKKSFVIDQARNVTEGERPAGALPEPQRALPAPMPEAIAPQEVAPTVAPEPVAPVRNVSPLGFYSVAEESSGSLQPKGSPQQYLATLRNQGVPKGELAGFEEAFAGRPSITRDDVQAFFRERTPQVRETVYRKDQQSYIQGLKQEAQQARLAASEIEDGTPEYELARKRADDLQQRYAEAVIDQNKKANFEQYTMPGGENYREIVLRHEGPKYNGLSYDEWKAEHARRARNAAKEGATYEDTQAFQESLNMLPQIERLKNYYGRGDFHHDVPDIISHLRLKDRVTPEGFKDLNIEELQSDPYQRGRDEGFVNEQGKKDKEDARQQLIDLRRSREDRHTQIQREYNKKWHKVSKFFDQKDENAYERIRQAMLGRGETNFTGFIHNFWNSPEGKDLRDERARTLKNLNDLHLKSLAELNTYDAQINAVQQKLASYGSVPEAPLTTNPQEWAKLSLRRALKEAIDNGNDSISITPADEHVKRYGTDFIRWLKMGWEEQDKWLFDAGQVPHNRVDMTRDEPLDHNATIIESKDDLERVLTQTFRGAWSNRKIEKQANSIWEKMNTPDKTGANSGFLTPRKTGLEGWYDRDVPNYLTDIARRLDPDAKLERGQVIINKEWPSNARPIVKDVLRLRITPKMREAVQQGLPIYGKSEGGAVEMNSGGIPDVIDLETQVPERKVYDVIDLETQVPGIGAYKDTSAPAPKRYEPFDLETKAPGVGDYKEREYIPYVPADEPEPVARRAPSPMAYAPPQPSSVGNTALQAIRKAAPEEPLASKAMSMPATSGDFAFASDISRSSRLYNTAPRFQTDPSALVFHHTAGRGNPQGVMAALNAQGYGVHYIIDRDGGIHQSLPTNRMGIHTGVSTSPGVDNRSTLGVELIANHDEDVTPAQIEASKRLYAYLQQQYPQMTAYGHGELSMKKLPDEGYRAVMAIRGPDGQWRPSGGRAMPNVPVQKRTLTTYRTGEYSSGGNAKAKTSSVETLDEPKERLAAPQNVQWRVESAPDIFNLAPSTQPQGQNVMPGTLTGSVGTQLGGGTLSAYGGVNPQYIPLPKSPVKNDLVFPTYGVSWQKPFKQGGTVTEKALMIVSQQAKRRRGRPD
jgi:hypothetical protein